MKHVTLFLLLPFFLSACAASGPRPAQEFYVSEGLKASLLPPSAFEGERAAVQEIRNSHGGADRVLTGVVKLSPEAMQVIVLADMARIMTVNYTAAGIESEFSPLIPASNIEPEYILFDVQLTYFPVEAVNAALPPGLSFREEGKRRSLYRGRRKIAEIVRGEEGIMFKNLERSYAYTIKELEN